MAIINGGPGDDIIPRGSSTLDGGGNVTYDIDDEIYGKAGNDNIGDGGGNNALYGGTGNDALTAGLGHDTLYGGNGNDYLNASGGNDFLYGGDGNDFLWIFNGNGDPEGGSDVVDAGAGNDLIQFDEYGLSTGTTATGGAGIDKLQIKLGHFYHPDFILDTAGYVVDLSEVWSGGIGTIGGSTITRIEAINGIDGGDGNDRITIGAGYGATPASFAMAATGNNLIGGNGGDDYISGGSYNENISGGTGSDTLLGNVGDDTLDGGGQNDTVYGGSGNDVIYGGEGENLLFGGAGNEWIYGGGGNDTFYGDLGVDTLLGGAGDDTYILAGLGDVITNEYGGIDTVKVNASYTLGLTLDNLALTGSGGFSGTGNALANKLTGNSGDNQLFGMGENDTLFGGIGADTLSGGLGADVLTGGEGADTFVFDVLESAANKDRINGFVHGTDKIAFDHMVFTAFAGDAAGPLDAAAFGLGVKATTHDQHIIYNSATGALLYDADGRGGDAAVVVAVLSGQPLLDAGDILLM